MTAAGQLAAILNVARWPNPTPAAERIIAALTGPDPTEIAEAVRITFAACWPACATGRDVPADWWTTPLGRLIYTTATTPPPVPTDIARQLLGGVSRQRVAALVSDGFLRSAGRAMIDGPTLANRLRATTPAQS